MTRRLTAIVLTVATVTVAQGSVPYAAAPPVSAGTPAWAATDHGGVAVAGPASPAAVSSVHPDAADVASIACLRGADDCFGFGSWDCCAELFVLMAIAGATQAWLAAGLGAWGYWYYCG